MVSCFDFLTILRLSSGQPDGIWPLWPFLRLIFYRSQFHKPFHCLDALASYHRIVKQSESKKIDRAKTPSSQRKMFTLFLRSLAPLRLCARHSFFPIFSSSQNFKYLWLVFSSHPLHFGL